MRSHILIASALLMLAISRDREAPAAPGGQDLAPRLRRPAALVDSLDGHWLYVANYRSGSLSVVDLAQRKTAAEFELGERLADLKRLDEHRLLAVDEGRHEAILLRVEGAVVEPLARLKVSPYPVQIAVARDGRRAFVASLWSHRLSELTIPPADGSDLAVTRVLDLPFAPRELLLVRDDTRLIAADAFAGRLALVDSAAGSLLGVRQFPAHNVRGLRVTPDGKMLAIAHQMLNELAHTVQNDIHWGMLMSNDLRWLPLNAALDPAAELYAGAHMHPLGDPGRGGADPSALAMTSTGLAVVAMGGADQVALGREDDFSLRRIAVGKRPIAVTISHDEKLAYVANTFGDSISVIDLEREESVGEISLGPQPELTLAERGEVLFYDGKFSHDRWMSCHSCHTDGHANGMLNDNFSDASFGAPKRVLSLLGAADTAPYAWSGLVPDVETQIRSSILQTMQSDDEPADEDVLALAAFVRTLAPPPSRDALRETADAQAIARGAAIFGSQKCDRCHIPPRYTSPANYDVDLADAEGNRRFNPPTLRGVGQRTSYFHDARAATLEEVFQTHGHQLQTDLSDREVADLAAFLRSL